MVRPLYLTLALLFAGGLMGSIYGTMPENPEVRRGDYLVLEGDFHVHTRFSDGVLSPFEVVVYAKREGLDVVGLTEHNMVLPGKLARWFSPLIDGPVILVGQEITTRDHHVIAVGLEKTVPPRIPLARAIAEVHAQNGIAIGAHPVSKYWKAFDPVADQLNGVEVVHPIALNGAGNGEWRWGQMVEFYEREAKRGNRLLAIGSSDYHFFRVLGVVRTVIFAKERTAESVLEAFRAKRTVVFGPKGEAFGDPELIALLKADPLPPKNKAPGYDATGPFDAIGRTLAWLGVTALVFLGRTKPGDKKVGET